MRIEKSNNRVEYSEKATQPQIGYLPGFENRLIDQETQKSVLKLLKRNSLSYFKSVLDFGCGKGENFPFLAKISECQSGIDVSHNSRAISGMNICPFEPGKMHFANASFDLICSFWTLQHIEKDEYVHQIIGEFYRLLESHSYALICEGGSKSLEERLPTQYITLFCSQAFNLIDVRRLPQKQAGFWRMQWPLSLIHI